MLTLAGCSGSNNGNDGGNTGNQPADNSFVTPTTNNPTNWQFNIYNFTQPFLSPMQNDMLHRYHIGKDEFSPYAVSLDKHSGDTAILKVRDGLTWHNGDPGDPVTSEDLYTKLVCEDITNATLSTFFTDLSIAGDKTVEISLKGSVNKRLFLESLNNYWLETPTRKYSKFVESWEDATTDKERSAVTKDIRNATFDEPHGNGPFQVESISNNRYRMRKYDHHPDADKINWDVWDIERVSTNTSSVLIGMEIDGIRNYTAPQSILKNHPDTLQEAYLPALWGNSLPFNCDHTDFSNVRVRQAIAEFIDREACANNYGYYGVGVEAPSGLLGNINKQNKPSNRWKRWVSDEAAKKLHRYNNPKRGRRLLRKEGYEKVDGKWMRPDGTRFRMPIKVPAETTPWHPVYQTIVGQLNQEGIDSSMVTIEETAYWANHYLAGNFVAGATGWTLQHANPYFNFDMYYNIDAKFMNLDIQKIEVPPFGNPDGKLQSVDIKSMMEELLVAEGKRNIELRDRLAWVTNQALPMLPITEINDIVWFSTDDWNVPDPDDPAYQAKWPLWWFPRMGKLQAQTG